MKIVEITNVDFSLRHFLLPLMRGLRDRGHEVIGVSAEGPLLDIARAEGFRIEPLPFARSLSPIAQWRAFRALLALLRREKPDLVHGHMPISGFLARIAAFVAGVPRVAYTCHGFLFNQPGPWPRRAVSLAMEWLAGRVTQIFMTVSAEEAADARRLRINRHAIAIGNGRDPRRFHPDPAARARLRAELGVAGDRVVIAAMSRLVRHKGIPELLAAMADVDAELWIVGARLDSDHGEDMEPYFERCGLGPRLRRLGMRDDVPAILAAADIFTLPSHFEGLPMSVIEAMLAGLPVVGTDIRGTREQVTDGVTGLLVPPATIAPLRRGPAAPRRRSRPSRPHGPSRPHPRPGRFRRIRGAGAHAGPAGGVALPSAMTDIAPIRRALISVSDKSGLIDFARTLSEGGVEILSTGGTANALREAGIPVTEVADHTGFPEILDGRVKTLVPQIHGGILGRRDLPAHVAQMEKHQIAPIDLVAVNLYPFEATVASGAPYDDCVENIDIGGPAMIRAAAKNHDFVTILTDAGQYHDVLAEFSEHKGTRIATALAPGRRGLCPHRRL